MNNTVVLEWKGKEYELKYTFNIIRRIRSEGINIPQIFRKIMEDNAAVADYGDDVAYVVAWLLKEAGCLGVTDEQVWRESLSDPELQKQCFSLFMWIVTEHFAQSDNLPKPSAHKKDEETRTSS